MGLFSSLASSFMEGWRSGQQAQHPPTRSTQVVPRNFDLIYPAPLLRFDEIAAGGHDDPRALVYALSWLDPKRKRPFACGELNALDFGNGKDGEKDWWLKWTDADGLLCVAFFSTCMGKALLSIDKKEFCGPQVSRVVHDLDTKDLLERGMVEKFTTSAERGAACGAV